MEKQKLLAKIKRFYTEKIYPNLLVILTMLYSFVLLIGFMKFINSLEVTSWNSDSGLWLIAFVFALTVMLYVLIRFSHYFIKSNSMLDRAIDVAEQVNDIAQKLSEIIENPRNPRTLVEKFLSIKSIFIYYVDNSRVYALYQQVVGRKQLQEVTEELVGEQGLGVSIGIKDIAHGEMSDKSTNKFSATSQIQAPSIDEQFLIVQSTLLRSDNIELGYELSLYQIENELNVVGNYDNGEALLIDDFAKWFSKEEERLNSLSGFILLEAEFLIQEFYLPQYNYKLTFTRPMVQNTVIDPRVEFRITLAKDMINVNEQLLLNNHTEKRVKFRVFGHVSAKSEGETARDKVIDILPLAIYQ